LARLAGLFPQRQAVWRAAGRATPPTSLPRIALPGRKQADRPQRSGVTIKGVAASPGFVTAPACVMHGPGDFSRMQTGRVLVAPITTPAWTPLFARAAAIVTDVGGPLSHGSIVAREYGIPAVLGTGCATQRIADGQTITVDGTEGKVTLVARPEPGVSSAIEWKRPNPKGQYMRGSVVDLLPDPVSPLFATLAIPAVARVGVKDVLRPLTRSEPDLPADYIVTINDYLYMGVAFTPHQWWWIVTRMMASFPRMLREALPLWRDKIRPHYAATIAAWEDKPLGAMSAAELWAAIQEVDDAAMLHLASLLVATTGASAGSEMLFTRVYGKLIRREGDPAAPTFLMGYDSTPIRAEKSLYDVAMWCQGQADLSAHLRETPAEELVAQLANGQTPVSGWQEFRDRLQAHLNDYGHIIYTLDFGRPLPLDDATPMLGTIKMYLAGQGINPYERQAAAEAKRIQAAEATLARLRGLRRWAFRKTLGMAQTMAAVREDALSDVGLGYPLLRAMLRELGRRLTEAGGIEDRDDIFWLEAEQVSHVVAALGNGGPAANLANDVAQRKSRHEMLKRVIPPPTLPPRKRYLGINMAEFTPAAAESQTGASLRGIGASAGRVTAPACVLAGPEDFDRMRPGDVLVAATTTPAWTPLFAMASAVITDIGGPLSHGSIVAREYGIPAVMGTGVATKRIPSGQVVTVDGGAGRVDW
jgi:pyruvate,water dikinase